MALAITATNVREISEHMWLVEMPPYQVRMFGDVRHAAGTRSVLLLKDAKFDAAAATLQFDAEHVVSLNIGTLPYAIAIKEHWTPESAIKPGVRKSDITPASISFGPGDQEFLRLASALSGDLPEAARLLLEGVRSKSQGDLKRGKKRNFSNTPDNYWYVIIQPRVNELSITIRGAPNRFEGISKLDIKVDRPGYTLFKVTGVKDVTAALELIFSSKRKE